MPSPESQCFTYLARDTIAKDLAVLVERIPLTLGCRRRGETFRANVYANQVCCPAGGERDYEVLTGMEFSIDHIEVA